MSKDFIGNELHVGDEVVFIEPHYHNLVKGTVVRPTPKGATVKYDTKYFKDRTTNRMSDSIMKVN